LTLSQNGYRYGNCATILTGGARYKTGTSHQARLKEKENLIERDTFRALKAERIRRGKTIKRYDKGTASACIGLGESPESEEIEEASIRGQQKYGAPSGKTCPGGSNHEKNGKNGPCGHGANTLSRELR